MNEPFHLATAGLSGRNWSRASCRPAEDGTAARFDAPPTVPHPAKPGRAA